MQSLESIEQNKESELLPSLLDIVKLDGRWAQVRAGGRSILFLDSGETKQIDWGQYELNKYVHQAMHYLPESKELTHDELMRIHWGPEQEAKPSLKLQCTYFGDFSSKKNIAE
ncbi:MAG: hypothetical protein Q8L47_04800 [bacterium]|nr:hypothetical protein [bacterium]